MALPDQNLVKTWCRIDGSEYDALLPTMIASATSLASHACGVDFVAEAMPESVQQWVSAHVAFWIDNPSAIGEKNTQVMPFLNGLLDPHRAYL